MNFNMVEEIFGFDGFTTTETGKTVQTSRLGIDVEEPLVKEIVIPIGPPSSRDTSLADAEFIKAVSGSDDITDACGFPALKQKGPPPQTLTQKAAQCISKSVNAVFPKVEFISASAPARKAKIAEILDQAKAALTTKGYSPDGWDGWPKLAKHADEYVISVLMEG
jgi:hypothetical protein